MADRPILFSAPMVRALLAGTKTQTRRFINPQPTVNSAGLLVWTTQRLTAQTDAEGLSMHMRIAVGDRLYVRETFRLDLGSDPWSPVEVGEDAMFAWHQLRFEADEHSVMVGNSVTGTPECVPRETVDRSIFGVGPFGKLRPGIHMPRWASRITLTVTDVRVQRLQEISDADSFAEGISTDSPVAGFEIDIDGFWWAGAARNRYRKVWEVINGPGSWDANPWVAAYTFSVERSNIDNARLAA